jgi:hypothetical protein
MPNSLCMLAPNVAERGAFFISSVLLPFCTSVMLVLGLVDHCLRLVVML